MTIKNTKERNTEAQSIFTAEQVSVIGYQLSLIGFQFDTNAYCLPCSLTAPYPDIQCRDFTVASLMPLSSNSPAFSAAHMEFINN